MGDIATAGGRAIRAIVAGVVGGGISELSGGKFANGARTAAFQQLIRDGKAVSDAEAANQGSGGTLGSESKGVFWRGVGDVLGKIWNLPNTIIGAVYGGLGTLLVMLAMLLV